MDHTGRDIDVRISGAGWPLSDTQGEAMVRQVLGAAEDHLGPLRDGALEVWFADNADLRDLNRRYRGKNVATNVLSFASPEMPFLPFAPDFGQLALADDVCRDEARTRALAHLDHARHLVLHGLLHLQGYDHQTPDDARAMEVLERTIMKKLGLHDPYVMSGETHD